MNGSLELFAVLAAAIVIALTWFVWWRDNGPLRSSLSLLCRVLWLVPIFAGLFPRVTSEPVPQQIQLTPVQMFVDDSESVINDSTYPKVLAVIEDLQSRCVAIGLEAMISILPGRPVEWKNRASRSENSIVGRSDMCGSLWVDRGV